jgi:hypothetical protein
MRTILIAALCACVLAGCTRSPDHYRAMSTLQLCMDYLTFPSFNIHQGDRAAELGRRNENCSAYVGQAAARTGANVQMNNALQQMNSAPAAPATSFQQGAPATQTYIINGKMMTCTTTGSVTNCF